MYIIDGSSEKNDCYEYARSLHGGNIHVYQPGYNIGHGRGMHEALSVVPHKFALVFDSDILMLKSPVEGMLSMMDGDTYGVGWVYEVGYDGFDYGTPGRGHTEPVPYLHPYFMLLNVNMYHRYAAFVHHGAPCYKAMNDLHSRGESWRLKSYPGLCGHTDGEGWNWKGTPSEYVQHNFGGTRQRNKQDGKEEIEGVWEK